MKSKAIATSPPGYWIMGPTQARSLCKCTSCTSCQINSVSLTHPLPGCTTVALSASYRWSAGSHYRKNSSIVRLGELLRVSAEAAEPRNADSPEGPALVLLFVNIQTKEKQRLCSRAIICSLCEYFRDCYTPQIFALALNLADFTRNVNTLMHGLY